MAKKKTSVDELPQSVEFQPGMVITTPIETASVTSTKSVDVQVPIFVMDGYNKKRLDFTMTAREAKAAKAVKDASEMNELQLPNGKYVTSPTDAIKLILNRIADAMGL